MPCSAVLAMDLENTEMWKKKRKEVEDSLLQTKSDRRMLPNVPDKEEIRTNQARRGYKVAGDEEGMHSQIQIYREGLRYQVAYPAKIIGQESGRKKITMNGTVRDISGTGLLLEVPDQATAEKIEGLERFQLEFRIESGTMPEGTEGRIRIEGKTVRSFQMEGNPGYFFGMEMNEALSQHIRKKKDRYALALASLLLFFIVLVIVLMRTESVLYFKFNKTLYLYSIVAAVFLLSRYLFGSFYRAVPIDGDFTPGVTIIIPCFNEEAWIEKTILSCVNQDYPIEKLEVLVVDDFSMDHSVEKANELIERLARENARFDIEKRVKCIVQENNGGKREALAKGVQLARHDLVVFVDSDSFLDPYAIRNLVQPFKDPKMGGVSGRTDVANTYTNGLTKMQSVRYYIAFRVMKAAEAYFDAVTCLSGPLSCYKKQIILDNMDAWLNQKFLGQRATFGDDRSMTNFVLRGHRTSYQDTAICNTIVPNGYSVFLKQQMRWKRSWLRESLIASKFMWKKEPFMAVTFYMGVLVPIAAPIVVLYNLVYVPVTHQIFPTTFLVGILMMSLLMSAAQLLLRKSSTWVFGMLFCFYYEAVLLWQMPIAWVTFWKSTWGTRMTPEDVAEEKLKQARKDKKQERMRQKRQEEGRKGEADGE